ncbi:leucine-rich repeat protein kinase family protein [Actinidia rufa]|uniref:Leucine-rich repeat protein kinase family protein n=1 Tax=Actinidia rufa TaxID=165716 RepID=A0A7J0F3W1_9ERIC|nr:leucine-rich repeat protein kinase family protein [Actinidia rufa]
MEDGLSLLCLFFFLLLFMGASIAQMPGFVSLDCGGTVNFTDDIGLEWTADDQFESQFYLSVSARINFGADSEAPVRYPDDPFDRIWESDLLKKANYLVDVAAGTEKVSTRMPIDVSSSETPPQKVIQTAVVGRNGSLTYRLNLDVVPRFWLGIHLLCRNIEDLIPNQTRKFRLVLPGEPELSKAVVNIQENAQGNYHLGKTSDSSLGPLLNAMEINKYLKRNDGSVDGSIISSIVSFYSSAEWAREGGDPCLPVPWSWVQCNSDPQPRIAKIALSGKNLTGNIPSDLTKFGGLVELWLDGNFADWSHTRFYWMHGLGDHSSREQSIDG